jgi:hypothetical protein
MGNELNDELKPVFEACQKVAKSDDGEFSMKWLRSAGHKFHWSKLKQLVELGYLAVNRNGIVRCGTAWYRIA